MKQISDLKDRVLKKKRTQTELTGMLDMIRELGCFSEVIGRDYEIFDKDGKIVYTIRQKPMAISQVKTLVEELQILKKLDTEQEAAKWKSK